VTSTERVAIIGLGRLGRSLVTLTTRAGLPCLGYDLAGDGPTLPEVVRESTLLVLCVPYAALPAALEALRPLVAPGQLVLDTCSVKHAVPPLFAALGDDVAWVASHPLFGPACLEPGAPPRRAVICPGPASAATTLRARAYYEQLGCLVIEMSAAEHDLLMARSQALAAFLGAGLRALGPAPESEWLPPSAAPLAQLVGAQTAAAGHLRDTLLHHNPYALETRSALLSALDGLSRSPAHEGDDEVAALAALRRSIDEVDLGLLDLLARRAELAQAISARKASLGRAVRDPAREATAFADRRRWAEARGLDSDFVQQIFEAILHWSRSLQERSRGEEDRGGG